MRRVLLSGLAVALVAGVVAGLSRPLSLQTTWPVVLAAGVGLVPGYRFLGRIGAFAVGAAGSWIAYAVLAVALPDSPAGRGVAVALAVVIVTVACAFSAGHLPLWAGLAGSAGFAGAYDASFRTSPATFVQDSVAAATQLILAGAIGFAVAAALAARHEEEEEILIQRTPSRPVEEV